MIIIYIIDLDETILVLLFALDSLALSALRLQKNNLLFNKPTKYNNKVQLFYSAQINKKVEER